MRERLFIAVVVVAVATTACGGSPSSNSPTGPTATPAPSPSPVPAPASTTIGGRLTNAAGTAIDGVVVEIVNPASAAGLRTTTDSSGVYRLSGIRSVTFTVRYSRTDYDSVDRTFTFMLGTERTDLDTRLSRTVSPGSVVYEFDAGISAGDRSVIETAVTRGKDYFRSRFGRTVERGFVVIVQDADGPYTAVANMDAIVVYARQAGWRPSTVTRSKIMVHEMFHLLQREVTWPGPTQSWLNEGSAEYVGYSAVIEWGMVPYGDVQACLISSYFGGNGPSAPALENLSFDAGNPVSSRYEIAWLGWDRLLAGPAGLAKLPTHWTSGFQSAFGRPESSFYSEFAEYRQSLRRPSGNPCASLNR